MGKKGNEEQVRVFGAMCLVVYLAVILVLGEDLKINWDAY